MWPFKKKEATEELEPKSLREVHVPEEHIMEILTRWDNWNNQNKENWSASRLRYSFWKYASKSCPEIAEGNWVLNLHDPIRPKFVEIEKC